MHFAFASDGHVRIYHLVATIFRHQTPLLSVVAAAARRFSSTSSILVLQAPDACEHTELAACTLHVTFACCGQLQQPVFAVVVVFRGRSRACGEKELYAFWCITHTHTQTHTHTWTRTFVHTTKMYVCMHIYSMHACMTQCRR